MLPNTLVYTYLTNVKVAKTTGELPWWLSGKEPPAKAEDVGLITAPGRCHVPQSNEACVPQLLSPGSRAQEPQLLSLCSGASALPQEKPLQWGAHVPQPAESPHSSENPGQPKQNKQADGAGEAQHGLQRRSPSIQALMP